MGPAALRFTSLGVVSAPETVQIRIAPDFEGRVALGAPRPSRAMTGDEVRANVRHFRNPGPRYRPVRGVALSGVPSAWNDGARLGHLVSDIRETGVETVVLHLTPDQVAASEPLDVVRAVAVRRPADVDVLAAGPTVRVTVLLDAAGLAELPDLLSALSLVEPQAVTLLWPYPNRESRPPPAAHRVVARLQDAAEILAQLPWGIKGLPRCTLRSLEPHVDLSGRIWRSANRFYVDADHQQSEAFLLRPDLLQLTKLDSCRFCMLDHQCEGVASDWLWAGLTDGLSPVEDVTSPPWSV